MHSSVFCRWQHSLVTHRIHLRSSKLIFVKKLKKQTYGEILICNFPVTFLNLFQFIKINCYVYYSSFFNVKQSKRRKKVWERAITCVFVYLDLHAGWSYNRWIGVSFKLPINLTTIFSTKSRTVSIVFASSCFVAKPCPELVAAFSTPKKFKYFFNLFAKHRTMLYTS